MTTQRIAGLACLFALFLTTSARGGWDFSLSLGYSHLSLDGSDSFANRDGMRFESRVTFGLVEKLPQLRMGFGLGFSGYSHELDTDTIITIDNGSETTVIFADQWEGVSLLEPEFQLSWRQPFGNDRQWFIEPGVGIGWTFANYYVADEWYWDDDEISEWDSTFTARPFVRAGYQSEGWMVGLEAFYTFGGDIDLTDQVQGELNELYIGGFFGWRW